MSKTVGTKVIQINKQELSTLSCLMHVRIRTQKWENIHDNSQYNTEIL